MAPARLCLEQDRPFVNWAFGSLDVAIFALYIYIYILLLRNYRYHICLAQQTTWNKVPKLPLWKLQKWSQSQFSKNCTAQLLSFPLSMYAFMQRPPTFPILGTGEGGGGKRRWFQVSSKWVRGFQVSSRWAHVQILQPGSEWAMDWEGARAWGLGTPAFMDLTQRWVSPSKNVSSPRIMSRTHSVELSHYYLRQRIVHKALFWLE